MDYYIKDICIPQTHRLFSAVDQHLLPPFDDLDSRAEQMEQDEWEDKEGNKGTSYSIVADNFNFLGSGKKDDETTGTTEATKTTEKETVPF